MKNYAKIMTLIAGATLVALVVLAPTASFAKDNGKGNGKNDDKKELKQNKENDNNDGDRDDDHGDKKDKKENKSCLSAFGHLIALGWLKSNSPIEISDDCRLPFGIWKKIEDRHGTTTPPTATSTAPVISGLTVNSRLVAAVVRWNTNKRADSSVFYSTLNPVDLNASTTKSLTRSPLIRDHRLVIGPLTNNTTYYVIVRSRDAFGNTTTSNQISFVTSGLGTTTPPVTDTTAPIISNATSTVATSTAQINWTTNENATSKVYYSTVTPLDITASTTLSMADSTLVSSHSVNLAGLATSTVYHVIIESKDAAANTARTSEFNFTTTSL